MRIDPGPVDAEAMVLPSSIKLRGPESSLGLTINYKKYTWCYELHGVGHVMAKQEERLCFSLKP